jgi:hypothetical protein
MIGCLIVFGVSLLVFIGLLIYEHKNYLEEWQIVIAVFCFVISFISLCVICINSFLVPKSINEFTQQSEYIENHTVKSDIENAAITTKKIELNSWLYNAKWFESKFGIFSFYPDSIQELEPIQ